MRRTGLENLEEAERSIAGVLDVVTYAHDQALSRTQEVGTTYQKNLGRSLGKCEHHTRQKSECLSHRLPMSPGCEQRIRLYRSQS